MSRTQIQIAISLLVVAHLLLAPLGLAADRNSPAHLVVLGALIAQPALLGFWAVLAPQAFVRRFSQAMTGLAFVYLTFDFASVQSLRGWEAPGGIMQPVAWFTSFFACQLPLWLLRVRFRWQLWPPAAVANGSESQANRFSLRGLLVATAVVAAMFAALRWLQPTGTDLNHAGMHLLMHLAIGGLMSLPGLLVLAVGWIVLTPSRRIWRWSIGIVSACSVVGAAIAVALKGSSGEVWELILLLAGTLSCATGTLLVVRLCGYRLVRRNSGGEREPTPSLGVALALASRRRFVAVNSSIALVLAVLAAQLPGRLHLWRERAEERRWRDVGYYVTITDGRIVTASTNDGGQHSLNSEAIDRLGLCHDLARLDLTGSTVDDETLERLPALPNLTSLSLTATRVSDRGLQHLTKFSKLTDLGLRLTDVSDKGLAFLEMLDAGAGIDIGNTRVTSQGIARLRQVRPDLRINAATDDFSLGRLSSQFRPQLTAMTEPVGWRPVALRMHAVGRDVTDAGVAALRGMTNIEELDLTDARVTDGAINDLAALSGLKKVVLKGTQVSNSGIARLQRALPGCTIDH